MYYNVFIDIYYLLFKFKRCIIMPVWKLLMTRGKAPRRRYGLRIDSMHIILSTRKYSVLAEKVVLKSLKFKRSNIHVWY